MSKILQKCQVQPLQSMPHQDLKLPLSHFDIPLLLSNPIQSLLFYEFACSKPYFIETIIPKLKQSLSLVLNDYLPLSGKILVPVMKNPNTTTKPYIHYITGDSVSLTFSESDRDITYFTGHSQRAADEFYDFVPDLPKPETCSLSPAGFVKVHVLSLQVTLFPDRGLCVGVTNHHAVGDANTIWNFTKLWALFSRLGGNRGNGGLMSANGKPFFDRVSVEDPEGRDKLAWELVKDNVIQTTLAHLESPRMPFSVNKVRSTFILTKDDVDRLKNFVSLNRPNTSYVSSFTVISAYIWTCFVRSSKTYPGDKDKVQRFGFGVDCRTRLTPPLPSSYFGNCLIFIDTHSERKTFTTTDGKLGFLTAVELIGDAIQNTLNKGRDDDILEASDWPMRFERLRARGLRVLSIAGSPRFDLYEVDYGWGRAKKHEYVHIDVDGSVSFSKARDLKGGFEIGVSMEKMEMDCFESAFVEILGNIISSS